MTDSSGEKLFQMWKGSNTQLELTDLVDGSRTDLLDVFEADPLARHDLELQCLVSGLRGSTRIPRLVLLKVARRRWVVARVSPVRGAPPVVVSSRIFDDLRATERYAFNLRLQLLTELEE